MHHGYLLWGCYLRFSIYLQKCHFTVCNNAYSRCFMLHFSTACRACPLGIGVVGGRSPAFGCPSSCHRPIYVHLLRDHGVTNVSFHYHRIRSWSTVPTAHHQGGPHGKLLVRQQQKQATRLLATRTEQEPWQAGITFALLFEFRELLGQEAPDPSGYGLYPALTPKAEPR